MPNSKDYKHIKVGSVQNDEVVIKAGKPTTDESAVVSKDIEDTPASTPAQNPITDNSEKTSNSETRESTNSSSSYSPTTLDDLEVSKMSKTQIAVIVVALIALASFIIWYIVFS